MSYRLDMEAWDEDVGGSDQLIEKQTVQNWLQPSNQWKDIKAGFHLWSYLTQFALAQIDFNFDLCKALA